MADRKPYPSDLTDEQWALIEPLVPPGKPGGAARSTDLREVLNTILYQARTGCQWAYLPHDLLPKSTVWDYFNAWKKDGTWQRMTDALRRRVRTEAGRDPEPRVAAIDSQTVPTHHQGADCGVDGGKGVTGRKRHIVVCSLGLLLAVSVTAANLNEGTHAPKVLGKLSPETTGRLEKVYADNKYHCQAVWEHENDPRVKYRVVVVRRQGTEFKLLPQRWVVERTFAWLGWNRRLSKDYERTTSSAEAWCQMGMIHTMLRRLAPSKGVPAFKYPRRDKKSA
jgi:putative transposase